MPGIVAASAGQRYACKCLNVCILTAAPLTAPPASVDDTAYSQVYVGDDGILVKHPQLTLRSRQRIAHIPETNRYSRFITLTCMLCDLPAYRIFQEVPADVEGKDGPILPAEDWVEKETMKSPNGWIEVHNDCLTGDAIIHAEKASSYSSLLTLVVPPLPPTPVIRPEKANGSTSEEPSPPPEPPTYLSHLKSLFPPPPFTPTHPAFLHLASLAEKETKQRREAAEKAIADFVQQKTEEIEQKDALLRKDVDGVWRKFRESIRKVHAEHHPGHHHPPRSPMTRRASSKSRERNPSSSGRNSSPSYGTPIAVRDFVPVSVSERPSASSPPPRTSALSASLATTTFHHPRALRSSSPDHARGSPDSGSSRTLSTRSGSATLVQPATSEGVNVLQFRRNVDDTINTQATYRFFVIEEEMANLAKERERKQQAAAATKATTNGEGPSVKHQASSKSSEQGTASSSTATENPKGSDAPTPEEAQPESSRTETKAALDDPPTPSRGRDPKGKRKVTFDVEPAVVTIDGAETESSAAATPVDQEETREMIFELEDVDGDKGASNRPAPSLPFLEQPAASRPSRNAVTKPKVTGLPESFAGLRPSSLPNPSHVRPLRSPPGVDSSNSMMLSLPRVPASPLRRGTKPTGSKSPPVDGKESGASGSRRYPVTPVDPQAGSWSADGQTWHAFSRPHTVTAILEESEAENTDSDDKPRKNGSEEVAVPSKVPQGSDNGYDGRSNGESSRTGVPASLPVHISLRNKPRETLSLASYQPQHAMPEEDKVPTKPNGKPMSSTAIRKAMYAERDRTRSVDPGNLDLLTEEEEDETENEEESAKIEALLSTTRGRRQALKILQAANQLPEAGMWRSLAS